MPRPLYKHFKCFLSMVSGDHVACTVFRRCYEANIVATVPVLMTPKARDQEAGDPVGGDPLLTTGSPVPSAGLGPCLMCSSPTALGGWLRTSEPKAQQIHSKAERRMAPTLEKAGRGLCCCVEQYHAPSRVMAPHRPGAVGRRRGEP